jgi:tRNA (guanine37-N1)-methyltransferase
MKFDLITIFPEIFDSYINKGMLRVAREKKIIKFKIHNLREQAIDNHGTVDDRPFGGGPGQVFMVEPIYKTLKKIKRAKKSKVVLLSAQGKKWNQQLAQKFSKFDQLIFICPRYEGVDERVKKFIDEEISIGDYILTGGELGALVIIDSVTRLIPGVLGKQESLNEESHSTPGYLEYPQYTRPEVFKYSETSKTSGTSKVSKKQKTLKVPKILLSGHHANIEKWRDENSTKSHNKIKTSKH